METVARQADLDALVGRMNVAEADITGAEAAIAALEQRVDAIEPQPDLVAYPTETTNNRAIRV